MTSHMLVVQSEKCKFSSIAAGSIILDYTIGDKITKPISARLITVDGYKKSVLVYTDFTDTQIVNGKEERYLGISTASYMQVVNPYIPITGNKLPNFGFIRLSYTSGKFDKIEKGVTVVIEIIAE